MDIQNLPTYFWVGYYIFLFATIAGATHAINNQILPALSRLNIFVSFSIIFVGIFGKLGQSEGAGPENVVFGLATGKVWTLFFIASFLLILVWWIRFLIAKFKKT